MERATLKIRLPKAALEFAKRYAEDHNITLAELIDRQLKQLRSEDRHADQGSAPSDAPVLNEDLVLDQDHAAFQKERERLLSEMPGGYVAYSSGKRVATAESLEAILAILDAKFPDEQCFIQQVSQEPRRVTFRRPHRVRALPC